MQRRAGMITRTKAASKGGVKSVREGSESALVSVAATRCWMISEDLRMPKRAEERRLELCVYILRKRAGDWKEC